MAADFVCCGCNHCNRRTGHALPALHTGQHQEPHGGRWSVGYTCDATLELQQKSGSSWETVKEWSSSGRVNDFDEGWYVVRGDYRLKASALVFDPTGRLVENQTAYSSVVEY